MECPDCGRDVHGKTCACGWGKRVGGTPTEKRIPVCVRCGVVVNGANALYTLCLSCIEDDHQELLRLAANVNGAETAKGDKHGGGDRPAGDSGPSAGTLLDTVPF